MFSQASVILFTGGVWQTSLWADTPPGQTHSPGQTLPLGRHPLGEPLPPGQTPQRWLQTVYIILECILVFTGHNKVVAKVIFLHLFFILFTGGSASLHAGITPPQEKTPPDQTPRTRHHHPGTRHLPGPDTPQSRPLPPGPGTPPEQTPQPRHIPPDQTPTPPDQAPSPLGPGIPLFPGSRLQHTVYEQPVHILLECILVHNSCLIRLIK